MKKQSSSRTFLALTTIFLCAGISTAQAEIKNIIFDFGGVVIDIEHARTANAFKKLGAKDFTEFYSQNRQNFIFEKFEAGKLPPSFFRAFSKQKLGIANVSDEDFDAAWNALIVGYKKETLDFLESIKDKYNIYLLSNTNEIHYDYFSRLYEQQTGKPFSHFNQIFKKAYYAQKMQLKKPHAAIYQTVLNENGLKPEETLYVDDTPAYAEGGAKVGMHSLLITQEQTIFTIPQYIEALNRPISPELFPPAFHADTQPSIQQDQPLATPAKPESIEDPIHFYYTSDAQTQTSPRELVDIVLTPLAAPAVLPVLVTEPTATTEPVAIHPKIEPVTKCSTCNIL